MKTSPRPADVWSSRPHREDAQGLPSFTETRPDADRIAQRAYYARYEARGREDGHDMEHWFEAERELNEGVSSDSTSRDDGDVNSDEAA